MAKPPNIIFDVEKVGSCVFLVPADVRERLDILVEELAEAIHMIQKAQRHGLDSEFDGLSNRQYIEVELGDVQWAIDKLVDAGDLSRRAILLARRRKASKNNYLHHQGHE
jgi:NTP pyrophosphatase (non-canonical NTP hydrolase)